MKGILGPLLQFIGHCLNKTDSQPKLFVFLYHSEHFTFRQHHPVLLGNVKKVFCFRFQCRQNIMDLLQTVIVGEVILSLLDWHIYRIQELLPGQGQGIGLTQIRKHVVYIVAEYGIQRQKAYLIRAQGLSLLVKEICNPLQQH